MMLTICYFIFKDGIEYWHMHLLFFISFFFTSFLLKTTKKILFTKNLWWCLFVYFSFFKLNEYNLLLNFKFFVLIFFFFLLITYILNFFDQIEKVKISDFLINIKSNFLKQSKWRQKLDQIKICINIMTIP